MPKGIYIRTEEHNKNNSNAQKKRLKNPGNHSKGMKGKSHTDESKRKISKKLIGIKRSEKFKRKMSKLTSGENNPNWQGGISFELYSQEWTEELRECIRNRDNRNCKLCNKTEKENDRKLTIHHIDYNKKNNNPKNLITLCISCNFKVNYNRNYWIDYFKGDFTYA